MTLNSVRDKPGQYKVEHVETGRLFVVRQHPARWDWRAEEALPTDKGPKFERLFKNEEIWSKKDLLTKLESFITNPPKKVRDPLLPNKVNLKQALEAMGQIGTGTQEYPKMKVVPTFEWKRHTGKENGYIVTVKNEKKTTTVLAYTDAEGWWYADTNPPGKQHLVTGAYSKKFLEQELIWLYGSL